MRPSTYLKTLWRSLTSIEFYSSILSAPFWFSVRFFLLTFVLIGLIVGSLYARELNSFVQTSLEPTLQETTNHFPEDGKLLWNGDRLEVSPDPFSVYYPNTLPAAYAPPSGKIAVLTNQETTPEELFTTPDSAALSLVTPTSVFIRGTSGWVQTGLQDNLQDQLLLITPETLPQHLVAVKEWILSTLPLATYLFPVLTVVALLLHRVWIAFIESLLIYLLFRFNQIPIPFLKSLQLALHILIPAEIVHQIAGFTYPNLDFSLLSLTFWVILIHFFFSQRKRLRSLLSEKSL